MIVGMIMWQFKAVFIYDELMTCSLTYWMFGIFQSFSRPKDMTWRSDLFNDSMAASGIETGTKLYISNLDYAVCNEDIKVH
jgi:hypothetical protein